MPGVKTPSENSMDVTVVIINWNSGPWLENLLRSLKPLESQLQDVIVADNASEDGSERAAESCGWVQLLRFSSNHGFAGAANRAIAAAGTEYILLLNPDVEVMAGSISGLLEVLVHQPGAALACGPLLDHETREPQSFQLRPLPTRWGIVQESLFLDEFSKRLWKRERRVRLPTRAVAVEQPAAAYWLLRRKAWQKLAGFDETFFPAWFEDVDFCKRLADAGWSVMFCPAYPALHRGGLSLDRLGRRRFLRTYSHNLLAYVSKHHPSWYGLVWLPVKLGFWLRYLGAGR